MGTTPSANAQVTQELAGTKVTFGVSVYDSSGNLATPYGTEYTEGDTDSTITGKAVLFEDASDTLRAVSAAKPLPVTSQAFDVSVTLTRTNDTNGYAANDVVGAATGATAALTFANMGPAAGGRIMIRGVKLEIDAAAVIASETSYTLQLYNVTPPSALGDNAAWDLPAGDRASYLGPLALGTPLDVGSTLYIATNALAVPVKLASGSLFGYLTTAGAYTPTASRVFVITIHADGV